jgi:hypothetical protein
MRPTLWASRYSVLLLRHNAGPKLLIPQQLFSSSSCLNAW